MLPFMILITTYILPDWMFKPMQENDFTKSPVAASVCEFKKDTRPTTYNPLTWVKNDQYSCKVQ